MLPLEKNIKKIVLTLSYFILCASWVSHGAFLVKEKGEGIISEGNCSPRYALCSSVKIALALMGFDAEILKDEATPSGPLNQNTMPFVKLGNKIKLQKVG